MRFYVSAWLTLAALLIPHEMCAAAGILQASWVDPVVQSANCAPESDDRDVLRRLQVELPRGARTCRQPHSPYISNQLNEQNATALVSALNRIESLGGNAAATLRGVKIVSGDGLAGVYARRCENKTVFVSPMKVNDTGILVHELGRQIGLKYEQVYFRTVGACRFSNLAAKAHPGHAPRSEEFAEVFTAYVMNPLLLAKGSANCRRAYNFMARAVFAGGPDPKPCATQTLVAKGSRLRKGDRTHSPSRAAAAVSESVFVMKIPD